MRLHYGSYNDVQPKEKNTPETWENNNDQSISRQQTVIQETHLLFEGSFSTKLCLLNNSNYNLANSYCVPSSDLHIEVQ